LNKKLSPYQNNDTIQNNKLTILVFNKKSVFEEN